MTAQPQVTFLLVCYNHKDYVAESIRSVLAQTYANVQLVVVDDNSSDGSDEVIRQVLQENHFTYIRNAANRGLNNSILEGLKASTGDYISFLASDDFVVAEKSAKQVQFILNNNLDGVYSTGYAYQDGRKDFIKINSAFKQNDKSKILHHLYQFDWGVPLQQSSLLKKEVMLDLVGLRQQFKSDDWAFIIKAYEQFNIGYLDEPLFYYRIHDTNTHKKYWFTFPMRVDIASRLVPEKYRVKTLANIFLSQSQYLFYDKKYFKAFRFFLVSLILSFSFKKIISMMRTVGGKLKASLSQRKSS